ncbi:MAG: sulfotransferase, partial [Anaerolineales bacterium]
KPNFFIVGAPRCATTALYRYLCDHPNIFMPRVKEPHFFAEDISVGKPTKTLDWYMGLFEESSEEHLAVGEASVFYLYSSVAVRRIYEFNKEAKIIVILRTLFLRKYSRFQFDNANRGHFYSGN